MKPRYCHFRYSPFVLQNALLSLYRHYAPIFASDKVTISRYDTIGTITRQK